MKTTEKSGERALLVVFCGLLRKAMDQITDRDAYEKKRAIEKELSEFVQRISAAARPTVARNIFDQLYGFSELASYPHDPASITQDFDITVEEIVKFEDNFLLTVSQMSSQIISDAKTRWLQEHPCACHAKVGETHGLGCRYEECPFCHGLVWGCACVCKHLKLGWGGRSAKEWRQMEKKHRQSSPARSFDRKSYIRPLTNEEKRQWMTLVMKKGSIPYGSERRFQ